MCWDGRVCQKELGASGAFLRRRERPQRGRERSSSLGAFGAWMHGSFEAIEATRLPARNPGAQQLGGKFTGTK